MRKFMLTMVAVLGMTGFAATADCAWLGPWLSPRLLSALLRWLRRPGLWLRRRSWLDGRVGHRPGVRGLFERRTLSRLWRLRLWLWTGAGLRSLWLVRRDRSMVRCGYGGYGGGYGGMGAGSLYAPGYGY